MLLSEGRYNVFFNYPEGTHLVEIISSYLYVKEDNEIPVLAMKLLRKISVVSKESFTLNNSTLTTSTRFEYLNIFHLSTNTWG